MTRYAYLGPEGTFTQQALLSWVGAAEHVQVPLGSVDAALDASVRERIFPNSRLGNDAANVLIFAGSDAASGVRNILKTRAEGLEVGPILMGMGNKAHIVTPSITTRGLLNISALAGTPVDHYG